MGDTANTVFTIVGLITATISAFVVLRGQNLNFRTSLHGNSNQEMKTIFDAYALVVEELRSEVERLNMVVLENQQALFEQGEEVIRCEKRNNELIDLINVLQDRISALEATDGGQQ
jgi:Mg2+ and Co2+ transporter CorA